MTEVPIGEGEVLLQKYRVERVLGKGAMGVVVAARHLELGELFAIKFLQPHALGNAEAVERFIREARASARLKGGHVVKVHDVGRLEGGEPYMVMEHLTGADLQNVLKSRGPLPIDEAVAYMMQACEAVAEAHSLGIVHRDLKPANMFLMKLPNGAPCVKVLDFGISKQLVPEGQPSHELTRAGALLGSPLYMSPEQIRGKPVDTRSDVWALGAVLFEFLTGKQPFSAVTLPELIARIIQDEPPDPGELRPDMPPELQRILLVCLKKRPEDRFQTATELMNELAAFAGPPPRAATTNPSLPPPERQSRTSLRPEGAETRPTTIVDATARTTGGTQTSQPTQPPPANQSSAMRLVIAALIAGAAIGGGALVILRRTPQAAPPPPPPTVVQAPEPPSPAPTATATATKTTKSKKWWAELPDDRTSPAATKLPAPRLKWLMLRDRATRLEQERKGEEAQAALREALEVARKQLGVEDAAYAETLQQLARVLAKMGKLEDAEKLLREAVTVLNTYGDPTEEGFDDARQGLVAVLVKQGKSDEAKAFWKEGDEPLPPPKASVGAPHKAPPKASASAPAAPGAPPAPPKPADPFEAWDTYKDREKK